MHLHLTPFFCALVINGNLRSHRLRHIRHNIRHRRLRSLRNNYGRGHGDDDGGDFLLLPHRPLKRNLQNQLKLVQDNAIQLHLQFHEVGQCLRRLRCSSQPSPQYSLHRLHRIL